MNIEGVYTLQGKIPGPNIAIFGGVHGNERVGVITLDYLKKNLSIERGTVYLVYANKEAIEKGIREVEDNLNRLFVKGSLGDSYEKKRAQELMKLLDMCDALLDIHAYNDTEGNPFVIYNSYSDKVAHIMDAEIISHGWEKLHQGSSDDYMQRQGKIGLCIEAGPASRAEDFLDFTVDSVRRFLAFFECIPPFGYTLRADQKIIDVTTSYVRKTGQFTFTKVFKSFETIVKGQVLARDAGEEILAPYDGYMIFPRPIKPIGGEVFILGRRVQ